MIIGYGICGGGEANRYMKKTLDEFKRLCDTTIILGNNITDEERKMIKEYGFKLVEDNREWGRLQWKIKQDFIERHISKIAKDRDMLICLDMDEVFCSHITKEWIENAPLDAYHVYVVDIWNDEEHYKPESCFWNVRIWRWNNQTKFKEKPVHCGLAPEWTYFYHRFAPFLLKHYGLMKKADRVRKIARYNKYDPSAQHLDRKYYDMLSNDKAIEFDEDKLCKTVEKEVESYKQTAPRPKDIKPKERFAYVKNPHGVVVDIPERHVNETLKRKGFEFVGWADDISKEMEDLFEGVPLLENHEIELKDDLSYGVKDKKEVKKDIKIKKPKKKKNA